MAPLAANKKASRKETPKPSEQKKGERTAKKQAIRQANHQKQFPEKKSLFFIVRKTIPQFRRTNLLSTRTTSTARTPLNTKK